LGAESLSRDLHPSYKGGAASLPPAEQRRLFFFVWDFLPDDRDFYQRTITSSILKRDPACASPILKARLESITYKQVM